MSDRNFRDLVADNNEARRFLCVGLDPQMEVTDKLSLYGYDMTTRLLNFLCPIIDATAAEAGMFKPNLGFYLQYGAEGIAALEQLFRYLRQVAPHAVHTLDLKGGDIGDTNTRYLEFVYGRCQADAATIHNYMGMVGMRPYLEKADKGAFVLARTSNPGADEFQGLEIAGVPLYKVVSRAVDNSWNVNNNCGVVAGASETSIEELAGVREAVGNRPVLSPGVGKQGGSARQAYENGADGDGGNIFINASSDITHAHRKEEYAGMHWAEAAGAKAAKFNLEIRTAPVAA